MGSAARESRDRDRDRVCKMCSLAGKKAVVFGGTSGIGLAACHQLVAAGAEVVAASREPEKAGRGELPAGIRLFQCDVGDLHQSNPFLSHVGC